MSRILRAGVDCPGVGVGLIICRNDGSILMYRRLTAPEAGCWSIVGGKIDKMELASEAARREAEEETGLKIGKVDFVDVVEGLFPQEDQHWVSLIYQCKEFSGEARLIEPDKHAEFGWFKIGHPPTPLSHFAAEALSRLKAH